jgi:hypothetical protein
MGRRRIYFTPEEKRKAKSEACTRYIAKNRETHNQTRMRSYHKHKKRINALDRAKRLAKKTFPKVLEEIKAHKR